MNPLSEFGFSLRILDLNDEYSSVLTARKPFFAFSDRQTSKISKNVQCIDINHCMGKIQWDVLFTFLPKRSYIAIFARFSLKSSPCQKRLLIFFSFLYLFQFKYSVHIYYILFLHWKNMFSDENITLKYILYYFQPNLLTYCWAFC